MSASDVIVFIVIPVLFGLATLGVAIYIARRQGAFRKSHLEIRPGLPEGRHLKRHFWIAVVVLPKLGVKRYVVSLPYALINQEKTQRDILLQLTYPTWLALDAGADEELFERHEDVRRARMAGEKVEVEYKLPIIRPKETQGILDPIEVRREMLDANNPVAMLEPVDIYYTADEQRPIAKKFWLAFVFGDSSTDAEAVFEPIVRAVIDREGPTVIMSLIVVFSRLTRWVFAWRECAVWTPKFDPVGSDVVVDDTFTGERSGLAQYVVVGRYIRSLPSHRQLMVRRPR